MWPRRRRGRGSGTQMRRSLRNICYAVSPSEETAIKRLIPVLVVGPFFLHSFLPNSFHRLHIGLLSLSQEQDDVCRKREQNERKERLKQLLKKKRQPKVSPFYAKNFTFTFESEKEKDGNRRARGREERRGRDRESEGRERGLRTEAQIRAGYDRKPKGNLDRFPLYF